MRHAWAQSIVDVERARLWVRYIRHRTTCMRLTSTALLVCSRQGRYEHARARDVAANGLG